MSWQWNINASTLIQLAENEDGNDELLPHDSVTFSKLSTHLDAQSEIGLTLSTRPTNAFAINGKGPAWAYALRSWCMENEDEIRTVVSSLALKSGKVRTPAPKDDEITSIRELEATSSEI
ncbi:hypothetical protein Acr_00g0063930 [Actinidia rufa]|uniref:Uncharacterized protein n=1 Tax=Actinidia rufa TaxID=165716 RepID=A0A7J0DRD1_9ERIC|nr:hypothetical protein Acr_00g0063930 [Actinidia rufa]